MPLRDAARPAGAGRTPGGAPAAVPSPRCSPGGGRRAVRAAAPAPADACRCWSPRGTCRPARLDARDLATVGFAAGTAPEALADDPVGRVLAAPLRAGEPVTDVRLVGPADRGPTRLVAVPVRLPDPGMVALLRVGDRIDLLATDPRGGGAAWSRPTAGAGAPGADDEYQRRPPGSAGRGRRPRQSGQAVAEAAVRAFVTYTLR